MTTAQQRYTIIGGGLIRFDLVLGGARLISREMREQFRAPGQLARLDHTSSMANHLRADQWGRL